MTESWKTHSSTREIIEHLAVEISETHASTIEAVRSPNHNREERIVHALELKAEPTCPSRLFSRHSPAEDVSAVPKTLRIHSANCCSRNTVLNRVASSVLTPFFSAKRYVQST